MKDIYDMPEFYERAVLYIAEMHKKDPENRDSDSGLFACPFCGGIGKAKWGETQTAEECELAHSIVGDDIPIQKRLFQMARYWYFKAVR